MASTYLTRTISTNNPTGRKTMTLSVWLKRATASASNVIFATGTGSERDMILFETDGKIQFSRYDGSYIYQLKTNRQFRDTSAWYHFVFVYDSTQSTSSDRLKIYVNGVQETSFDTASYPSQDYQSNYSQSTYTQTLGRDTDGNFPFDGCMSHVHYVDGTALTPSTFGETDANGVWKINTSPSVTYGINGFFLFKNDNSADDQSGNGNNFTVAGGTLTNTEDSPSNVFATLNPLVPIGGTYSNGNLAHTESGSSYRSAVSTIGASSGKYYAESKIGNGAGIINSEKGYGLMMSESARYLGVNTNSVGYYTGNLYYNATTQSGTWSSLTSGDIIMIALDIDNGYVYFGKNGTWQNSGDPTSGASGTGGFALSNIDTGGTYFIGCSDVNGNESKINFGNGYFGTTAVASAGTNASGIGIFEYDVPTGYTALSTKGLNL